ncbi:MAG: hypothetical protein V4613_11045 [Bacteroidota bacterium]
MKSAYSWFRNLSFSKTDNAIRHWTATICHIQLTIGIILYSQSPVTRYFLKNFSTTETQSQTFFFGLIHSLCMLGAIVVVTIGSAKAKRLHADNEKFKTMCYWFGIGLLLILIAIPWPFSPLAVRPYFRTF